ncbi:MAG TPA: hypothetical protein VEA44_10025, partial [Caulobacter sp.]|nr:hypothetical protein [Caulobacter sp.]
VLSFAAPALSQAPPAPPKPAMPVPAPTTDPAAPIVDEDAVPPADPADDVASSAAQPAGIPTSSPTPVEQAYLLKAGDPTVTSNSPVPDTPATRAAYGGPDSNGGRKTRPVGN